MDLEALNRLASRQGIKGRNIRMRSASEALSLGILALCIKLALMLVKIGVGFIGNSYALIADGIESASDIFSSVVTWAGFRWSLKAG